MNGWPSKLADKKLGRSHGGLRTLPWHYMFRLERLFF